MAERLTRTSYVEPNGRPRQDKTGNTESRVDMERYLQPLTRAHGAVLHDTGVGDGLTVTATIGAAGVHVSPGVALDGGGRHIVLASGGKAKVDDETTTPVDDSGVTLATTGLTGPHQVTIAWADTFDRQTFTATGAFQLDDTPLLRVRPAGAVTAAEVPLATVQLDNGTVTELTSAGRQAAGITVESLRLAAPSSSGAPANPTVGHDPAFRLAADDTGGARGMRLYSVVGPTDKLIFSVLASGRLGVGTSLPSAALDVTGDLAIGGRIAFSADANTLRLNRGDGFSGGVTAGLLAADQLWVNGKSGVQGAATLMVVDNTADNTWNTAAFHKTAVGPNWSHIHWGSTGDWYIRSASKGGRVILQDTGGLVGVGRGSPSHTLDVFGEIGVNGLLAVSTFDGYLRFNQNGEFPNGTHTPNALSSGSMNVGGAVGWGNPGAGNLMVTNRAGIGTEHLGLGRLCVLSDGSAHGIYTVGAGDRLGLWAVGSPTAAVFWGNVDVRGVITKNDVQFKIDHPLDPENRYLNHSAVESHEMKTVYDGEVVLDAGGAATVTLPAWFEALNERVRYQLTPVGAAAPDLHVSNPLSGNAFGIAGGPAGGTVCWQVTGIRHDAYALANPLVVESDKPDRHRGLFRNPEAHGEPEERAIDFVAVAKTRGLG